MSRSTVTIALFTDLSVALRAADALVEHGVAPDTVAVLTPRDALHRSDDVEAVADALAASTPQGPRQWAAVGSFTGGGAGAAAAGITMLAVPAIGALAVVGPVVAGVALGGLVGSLIGRSSRHVPHALAERIAKIVRGGGAIVLVTADAEEAEGEVALRLERWSAIRVEAREVDWSPDAAPHAVPSGA